VTKTLTLSAVIISIVSAAGCSGPDSYYVTRSEYNKSQEETRSEYNKLRQLQQQAPSRFITLSGPGYGVAFDTATGQICRTWDWTPVPAKPPATEPRPEQLLGEFAPTCKSLATTNTQ